MLLFVFLRFEDEKQRILVLVTIVSTPTACWSDINEAKL